MSTIRPTISISELPVAISLDGGEYFPLVQGGVTKRATISLVAGASSDIQVGLNSISSTQGAVIFRGASEWEGLAPSTSGYLLSTQGAGADPIWVSSSSLGSLTIGTTAITSGTTTRILYDDAGTLGEYTLSGGGTAVAMANSPIFTTPSLDVATAISINGLTISSSTGTLTIANSSSLITSGAFATTLTVTGTTGVTLPISGTLATLAGSEALTNKTYNGLTITTTTGTFTLTNGKVLSVLKTLSLDGTDSTTMTFPTTSATIARTDAGQTFTGASTITSWIANTVDARGIWTAGATWTLPAITLGGTVSGGGQQLNNIIIGTSTPLAGAFTTLSATGALTYGGVTLTAAVTGTGKMVLDTSPTIATPVINSAAHVGGTWVADATWTLPALTLGGTVSGGGNQINNVIIGTSTPLAGSFTTVAASTSVTVTSASASALTVGLNGATNPAFKIDSSTGTQAAGLSVTGAIAAGTVAVAVISSGSDANLTINAKGTGTIGIGSVSTGAVTITPATNIGGLLTGSVAGTAARFVNTTDAATGIEVAKFEGDRATPTDFDQAYIGLYLSDSAGTQKNVVNLAWQASDVTAGTDVDALFYIGVMQAGVANAKLLVYDGSNLYPFTTDTLALGSATNQISDLFLAEGGVINWDSSDVTITQTGNVLAFAGASTGYTFDALMDLSGAAAGQIKFPASENPSADAHTLDDYEEGAWSPTITTTGTVGTPAYSVRVGSYEKIGRQVTVRFNVTLSGWTDSPTGNVNIGNLPFTSTATTSDNGIANVPNYVVTGLAALNYGVGGIIAPSTAAIILTQFGNTTTSAISAAQVGTTPTFSGSAVYYV